MLNDGVGRGTKSAGCDQILVFLSTANPFVLSLSCSPVSCRASCRDDLIEFRFSCPGQQSRFLVACGQGPAPGTTTSWCWSLQEPDGRDSWEYRDCASLFCRVGAGRVILRTPHSGEALEDHREQPCAACWPPGRRNSPFVDRKPGAF